MNKPRDFWLDLGVGEICPTTKYSKYDLHVVEYSAYEAALHREAKLVEVLEDLINGAKKAERGGYSAECEILEAENALQQNRKLRE